MRFSCTCLTSMRAAFSLRRLIVAVAAAFSVILLMIASQTVITHGDVRALDSSPSIPGNSNNTVSGPHRKLLRRDTGTGAQMEPNRIWGDTCSSSDIVITQGQTSPLPSGIPTYTVEVMNVCASGCDISGIHLSCEWFSSARLINPHTFKRLKYDDCLLNDGKPLLNGRSIAFTYANTFSYPLTVISFKC